MSDKKVSSFVKEFKDFIMRGNVLDLAVGVIIGAAFQGIVNSLVNDIIMPLVTIVTGGIDFQNWFISLDGSKYATLTAAKEAGASTLNYGVFLTAIINFLIMAFVIFMIVKTLNKLTKKKEEPEEEAVTTKACAYCKTEIDLEATRCPNCTSELPR